MKNGDIRPIEIMARREEWQRGISLYMRQETVGMGMVVAQPLELKQHEPGMICDPFLRLQIQEGQQLMDELWQCGLKPSEGTGSAGSLRATEKHLSDMRLIAMAKLNIKL